MNQSLDGNDDGFDNTTFFGLDGASSYAGSEQEHCIGLGGTFDQSISSHLDVVNDQSKPQSKGSIPMHRTSSCTTFAVTSNEEKENDYCDTIRDDILYVRHKASILQRASYILLQQQRDYHKVASYNACVAETRQNPMDNTISIWDEAKHFLQTENDSPDEINAPQGVTSSVTTNQVSIHDGSKRPEFHNVTSSMKSLSAVHQFCVSNRVEQPRSTASTTTSPKVQPFIGPESDAPNTYVPKYLIDTSGVQYVTSTQYDTVSVELRPLSEKMNIVANSKKVNVSTDTTIDNWYNQMTGDVMFQRIIDKKRKWHSIAACKAANLPSKKTKILNRTNHGMKYRSSIHYSQNDLIPCNEANKDFPVKTPLRTFHRILSSFNQS